MEALKYLIVIFFALTFTLSSNGQTIEKTYSGWWADTWWIFEFNGDGSYRRISSGHYGNTEVKGRYKIHQDTLQLLSGFRGTDGTVNEKYLIDNDSLIIDLELFFDYKISSSNNSFYNSKKRYDVLTKPNMDSANIISKRQLDSLVEHFILTLKKFGNIQIEDNDNKQIIRLINTIRLGQESFYRSKLYTDFLNLVKANKYEQEMAVFYDWIPSRGNGYYFQKLQVELGGSPHLLSRFVVK